MRVLLLGKTTLGHGAVDINIQGHGIAAQHCFIENNAGIITLHPCGNQCAMDGLLVNKPVRLSQGMTNMAYSYFEFRATPNKIGWIYVITLMIFHSSSSSERDQISWILLASDLRQV